MAYTVTCCVRPRRNLEPCAPPPTSKVRMVTASLGEALRMWSLHAKKPSTTNAVFDGPDCGSCGGKAYPMSQLGKFSSSGGGGDSAGGDGDGGDGNDGGDGAPRLVLRRLWATRPAAASRLSRWLERLQQLGE